MRRGPETANDTRATPWAVPTLFAPPPPPLIPAEFIFVSCFGGLHLVKSNFYLGAAKDILERLGDGEHDYLFTRIFTASLPASLVFVPLISWVESKYGPRRSFALVNAIGALHSVSSGIGGRGNQF